ncbi:unnamed protein product [Protopolystoma xenopodis]|uniref:Uncharacterized protein n=1 Tax=Protopolystoma xenopodis TaxID=117903 RepID=A0A3S5AST0_9PLAT|nr:unnamed protein product [Protopolystoma xenopodis]
MTADDLQSQAEICNAKKLDARNAFDESAALFFTVLVKVLITSTLFLTTIT